jgi:hypothetical protein
MDTAVSENPAFRSTTGAAYLNTAGPHTGAVNVNRALHNNTPMINQTNHFMKVCTERHSSGAKPALQAY